MNMMDFLSLKHLLSMYCMGIEGTVVYLQVSLLLCVCVCVCVCTNP